MEPGRLITAILVGILLTLIVGRLPRLGRAGMAIRLLIGAGAAALIIWAVPSGYLAYLVGLVIMAGIYSVFSLGLNVHWGYTGLFNIGIAGFFAVGAFTSALFTTAMPTGIMARYTFQAFGLKQPFLVGVLAGALVSGIIAFFIGFITLRLREDYLAIATLGIAETIRLVFQNERWLANGPQPLRGIPQPLHCLVEDPPCSWLPGPLQSFFALFEPRDYNYIYLVIVALFVVLIYWVLERMIRSPWGRVLRGIREDEPATAMSGKDIFRFKMQSLVLGAVIMGIGGALYAHYMISISYGDFIPLYGTFLIWVMLMLGGSGNNRGAILGAFVIWGVWVGTTFLTGYLPYMLKARAPYFRFLLIGILLEVIILLRPQGILGEVRKVSRMLKE